MKKIAVLFIALVASLSLFSQNSGKGFQYQAVARDANGNIRKNEVIEVRFSLVANSFDGVHHWIETHTVNTDPFGVFAVIIGKGLRDENSTYQEFSELNFRLTEYWLKIEIFGVLDKNNGFLDTLSCNGHF